jgi:hypothetical protein
MGFITPTKAVFASRIEEADSMKVKTDIKAGNLIDNAVQSAKDATTTVTGWVTNANQEANQIIGTVSSTATAAWNSLMNLFS